MRYIEQKVDLYLIGLEDLAVKLGTKPEQTHKYLSSIKVEQNKDIRSHGVLVVITKTLDVAIIVTISDIVTSNAMFIIG